MKLSAHANRRTLERKIKRSFILQAVLHGVMSKIHSGRFKYFLPAAKLRKTFSLLDSDDLIVIAHRETVVTVYWNSPMAVIGDVVPLHVRRQMEMMRRGLK